MRLPSFSAKCFFAVTAALLSSASVSLPLALAEDPPMPNPHRSPAPAPSPHAEEPASAGSDKVSLTSGTFTPAGRTALSYTAAAGYQPLKDESGKLRARIFYVAYSTRPAAAQEPATLPTTLPAQTHPAEDVPDLGSKRPLIFLFNGGPGAASVWLHLGAVGPRRLDIPANGTPPQAPYAVVENPDSWLASADLVFVDTVDTGYSRPAEPDIAKEFFGVQEDISSVAEFIRLYLTKHQRWSSPIFLAGESYGTTRVSGLAPYLQEHTGVSVTGVILLSTVLNFANLSPREGNDLPFPLYVPTYAALAWYHKVANQNYKTLDDCLKDAETFAGNEYTVALAKGSSLPDADKKSIAKKLATLTGLSEAYVLQSNLRIPPERFEKELLRSDHKIIGRFDGRLTGLPTDPSNDSVEYDPSLSGFYPAYASAFNEYIRTTLKYDNDLPYEVLSGRTRPWNYSKYPGGGGGNGYLYIGDSLRDAMTQNPHLKLLVCSGRFDLATPYFGTDYSLNHLNLAEPLQKNITRTYYPGGHMLYHVKENLEALNKNVASFIEAAK